MARCANCQKFILFPTSQGLCKKCEEAVFLKKQEEKKKREDEEYQKLLEEKKKNEKEKRIKEEEDTVRKQAQEKRMNPSDIANEGVQKNRIDRKKFMEMNGEERRQFLKLDPLNKRKSYIKETEEVLCQTSEDVKKIYNQWALRLYKKRLFHKIDISSKYSKDETERKVYEKELDMISHAESLLNLREMLHQIPHGTAYIELENQYRVLGEYINPGNSRLSLKNTSGLEYLSIRVPNHSTPYVSAGEYSDSSCTYDSYLFGEDEEYFHIFSIFQYSEKTHYTQNHMETPYKDFVCNTLYQLNREQILSWDKYFNNPKAMILPSKSDSAERDANIGYVEHYEFPCEWNSYCESQLNAYLTRKKEREREAEKEHAEFEQFLKSQDIAKDVKIELEEKEDIERSPKAQSAKIGEERNSLEKKPIYTDTEAENDCKKGIELYNSREYGSAIILFKKAAEYGNAEAQYRLALCYDNGHGVSKDAKEAVKWYKFSAEKGNALAQGNLAISYLEGNGVEKNIPEAQKWLQKAIAQNDANAMVTYGIMYEKGIGMQEDIDEANWWYLKAANMGNRDGQFNYGLSLMLGRGLEKNQKEAAEWFEKAAVQGHIQALNNLGIQYIRGDGVLQDVDKGLSLVYKAAEKGHHGAVSMLGNWIDQGIIYIEDGKVYRTE